jgi:phage repressor protein C with HTH and peptisase S24 domain
MVKTSVINSATRDLLHNAKEISTTILDFRKDLLVDGKTLSEIRKLSGLNQTEFGAKIHATLSQITNWEREISPIPEWAEQNIRREFTVNESALVYKTHKIPVIGYVSAGETSVEYDDGGHPVGSGFDDIDRPPKVKDPHAYALRVRGDSMENVYKDGDTIILDTTKPVHDKDEAIVRVGGKTYFKIYRRIMGRVTLQSFNREHPEFAVDPAEIHFAHRVVLIEPAERDLQDPLIGPALRHIYESQPKAAAAGAITTPEEVPESTAASDSQPGIQGDTKKERFRDTKGRKK